MPISQTGVLADQRIDMDGQMASHAKATRADDVNLPTAAIAP
jgi:hypothetical protein